MSLRDFSAHPRILTQLDILDTLQTAPLNESKGTWGVATMNVQANLPNALPGQSAVYILLGDVQIENDVPQDQALVLADKPLSLSTSGETQLHSSPDSSAEVVGTVAAGESLLADGISPDGDWLRVFYVTNEQASAWVALSDVEANSGIAELPVISSRSRTPMQAFRFQTNLGGVTCEEAPSAILVQGPENLKVDITANGADIRIGSLIMLTTGENGEMVISVLSGAATLNPDSPDAVFLPAGFTSTCSLEDIQAGACDWTPPEPYSEAIQQVVEAIKQVFSLSPNLFNYIPSPPNVVCASGTGEVICDFAFDNPDVVSLAGAAILLKPSITRMRPVVPVIHAAAQADAMTCAEI